MKNYEYKFQIKPGRFVYIPTAAARAEGYQIINRVRQRWQPARIFHHIGRRGGHVAAMKRHLNNTHFARRDISHFFGSITKAKLQRSLRQIGFPNESVRDIAWASVVSTPEGKHLPYGFVQSPMLATLALEKSALGSFILRNTPRQVRVTVFADDILLSSRDETTLRAFGDDLDAAAGEAGFVFGGDKTVICAPDVEAFNCLVTNNTIEVTDGRLEKFVEQLEIATPLGQESILRYVRAINPLQADLLGELV